MTLHIIAHPGKVRLLKLTIGIVIDNKSVQSEVFNVALKQWFRVDTVNSSIIDTLAVNNGSQVNVTDSTSYQE